MLTRATLALLALANQLSANVIQITDGSNGILVAAPEPARNLTAFKALEDQRIKALRRRRMASESSSHEKRNATLAQSPVKRDIFDILEAAWDVTQIAVQACVIAQCKKYVEETRNTVTLTSYIDPPATAFVNVVNTRYQTTKTPVTVTSRTTVTSPTTQIATIIGSVTKTTTQTAYNKRDVQTVADPLPTPQPNAWIERSPEEKRRIIEIVRRADDPGCVQAGKVMADWLDSDVEPDCDKWWRFDPPDATLIEFYARDPQTVLVTQTLQRTATTTVPTTTIALSTVTQLSTIKSTYRSTVTNIATQVASENLAQNFAYCTANAPPAAMTSLCRAYVGQGSASSTKVITSTPPATATVTSQAAVFTDVRRVAASETTTSTRTLTSSRIVATSTTSVSSVIATVTVPAVQTNTDIDTEIIDETTTITPTSSSATLEFSYKKRADTSCVSDPTGWFNRVQASNPTGLSDLCKAYLAVSVLTVTTTLVPGISTIVRAGQTVSQTSTTGTNTLVVSALATQTVDATSLSTKVLPYTITETSWTTVEQSTTTTVTASHTEYADTVVVPDTTTYTCPASQNSGKSTYFVQLDSGRNVACWYLGSNGYLSYCMYKSDLTGALLADDSNGACVAQLDGAPAASGYDNNAAHAVQYGRNNRYLCPGTDTSGYPTSKLQRSYAIGNTLYCTYYVSQVPKNCHYDMGSGALLAPYDSNGAFVDNNCYQRAAQMTCPPPPSGRGFSTSSLSTSSLKCVYSGGVTCYYGLQEQTKGSLVNAYDEDANAVSSDTTNCPFTGTSYVDGSG